MKEGSTLPKRHPCGSGRATTQIVETGMSSRRGNVTNHPERGSEANHNPRARPHTGQTTSKLACPLYTVSDVRKLLETGSFKIKRRKNGNCKRDRVDRPAIPVGGGIIISHLQNLHEQGMDAFHEGA